MNLESKVYKLLTERPSYLKCGPKRIADAVNEFDVTYEDLMEIKAIKKELNKANKKGGNKPFKKKNNKPQDLHATFLRMAKELGYTKSGKNFIEPEKPADNFVMAESRRTNLPKPFKRGNPDNILVIGDLHEPFCLDSYLFFCREQQEKMDCGTVIFIGDVIDNCFSSYHESDPDGYAAGQELDRAIDRIADWYEVFPVATVIIGNHDRMAYRKATTGGVSRRWVREYDDVLNTPNWTFTEMVEHFGINFNHGEGGTARNRIKNELQSQVQGHLHSQFYCDFLAGSKFLVFGMQVGCGIDRTAYSMAYGKNYKKPIIGCGVVLNKGTLPIAIPMPMD